jgi:rhamnosyltransferase
MSVIDTATAKRLGIYCFYDKNGRAAEFIDDFLADLTKNLDTLVVVVNGKLEHQARKMFAQYTSQIVIRENSGLDAAAYRQIMLQIGWDKLAEYDEVICLNDTIMGPVYSFAEMFREMDTRDVDFWGITMHHDGKAGDESIPPHVQMFWHAYRREFIQSKAFQEYWEQYPCYTDYESVTHKHEIPFTGHFEKLGFKWSVYVDSSEYEYLSDYPLLFIPTVLIREKRCPIFKRRSFFLDYSFGFGQTAGETALELYEYLKHETPYDTDLIWDALLHSYNINDIRRTMHLNYTLPTHTQIDEDLSKQRSAFIFHIYFLDLLSMTFRYLSSIPEETDLYITTTEDKIEAIRSFAKQHDFKHRITFINVQNRGRDVSALYVAAKDVVLDGQYDVIGFAHDKKSTQNLDKGHHGTESRGFSYLLLENTLGSTDYVHNILAKFAQSPRLGLLTPPPPIHGVYFAHTIPSDWGANFKNTKTLLERRLHIHVPLDELKPSLSAIGSCFWFRVAALRPLFEAEWEYSDFLPERLMQEDGTVSHAIERANGYVVQSNGYYPAWAMNDQCSRIELDSLWYATSELVGALGPKRTGETLLDLELWSYTKSNSAWQRGFARLKREIYLGSRNAAKHIAGALPPHARKNVYSTLKAPLSVWRAFRKTLRKAHGQNDAPWDKKEVAALTQKALRGEK